MTEEMSTDDMLGPPPVEAPRKGVGHLHTTGKPIGANCTGWTETLPDPQNYSGFVKTESLSCGMRRAWFKTKADLDCYVRDFYAAPRYNIRAAD